MKRTLLALTLLLTASLWAQPTTQMVPMRDGVRWLTSQHVKVEQWPKPRSYALLFDLPHQSWPPNHEDAAAAPLEKGKVSKLALDLWNTALVFDKGHRIALHVTGSNDPRCEVHPNSFQPGSSYDHAPVAHVAVEASEQYPSRLILPVVADPGTLDFYFLDVEEGNATLIVSPAGHAVLVDGGNPGSNARRFLALATQIGVKQLDYLVVTHYHADHYGATPEISRQIPILNWVDHGPNVEHDQNAEWQAHWVIKANEKLYAEYLEARGHSKHTVAKPGDNIALDGMNMEIVCSAGRMLTAPLAGAGQPNPSCGITPPRSEDETEDGQSIGMRITFGKFRYACLGDLTWNKALKLFCPKNLIGPVDVYVTTHHGMSINREVNEVRWGRSCCSEAEVHGLRPRVTILNSGEKYHKLGTPRAWQVVHNSPGLEGFWQLHYEVDGGKDNNVPEPYIANPTAANCEGHWIKLSARKDGTFTVTNSRNGFSKKY